MLSITPSEYPVIGEDTMTGDLPPITPELGPEIPPFPAGLDGQIQPTLWRLVGRIDEAVKADSFEIVPGSDEKADFNLANIAPARLTQAGTIHIYAEMDSFEPSAIEAIKALGAEVVSANERVGAVEAWVPYDKVDDLAELPVVDLVRLPMYPVLNSGAVTSAGDSILNANDVRSRFDSILGNTVDGSGIKIGVISDGVDDIGEVQGGGSPDLPSVTVNGSRPGEGNEGVAMLEIIHDLAPGAGLYFSSGIDGVVGMADSIDWLVGQGVDVIVDDLGFLGQHYFSDDSVAQAAADAIGDDVVYVSAAGNLAQMHYQGQWSIASGVHDFDPTGAADIILNVGNVPNGGQIDVILQWSDPLGGSANDYNLGLYDTVGQSFVAVSTDTQNGTQDALEFVSWTNTTGNAVSVGLVIDDNNSPASRELEVFVVPRNFSLANLTDNDRTTLDSVFGHAAVDGVISVAAIDAADSGNDAIEIYSSQGSSTIYTNFGSQTSTTRDSVDGAGIDGVNTQIGDLSFFSDPFYGTSAAAPHVAAIAALMLDANSSLTPAQVHQFLEDTAVDLTTYGAGYDDVSGAGRFDALSAVFKAYAPGATDLVSTSDWGFSETDNKTFDTTPTFTGTVPEDAHVWLYVDGTAVADAQLTGGATTYNLTPSSALSTGTKSITIKVAESGSIAEANRSQASSALSLNVSDSDSINLGTESFSARLSETLVVSGSNTGSSTLAAAWGTPARKFTKTGTGTLTVSTVGERTSTVTFDADAGTTQFTVDTGVAGIPGTSTRVANWTINGDAAVSFTTHQNLAALNIEDSGVITVTTATPPSYKVLYTGALDIVNGGKLDLTNNAMVIDYANDTAAQSDESDIRDWIIDGRGSTGLGGDWDGTTGITSSTAATRNQTSGDSRSVGYAVNADMPLGAYNPTFLGQTVDSSTIIVRYTVTCDHNLDGRVDNDDVTVIGAAYAPSTPNEHWSNGDADFNGFVDNDDITLLGAFEDEELES